MNVPHSKALHRWLAALPGWGLAAIVLLVMAAYSNSFAGVFVDGDEETTIMKNRHIDRLWPLSEAMSVPQWGNGRTFSCRPVLSVSFALTHACVGRSLWWYHAVNLAIHCGGALLLFGIVRRGLYLHADAPPPVMCYEWFALSCAALWALHPLQTEAVTFIVQRAESMAGMFYLLTVYSAIRAFTTGRRRTRLFWYVTSVCACLLGTGTKQLVATAPLFVLLFDGILVSKGYARGLRRHGWFYLALASSWVLLAYLQSYGWGEVVADARRTTPWTYLLTQAHVLCHYLRLTVWPAPLQLYYGLEPVREVGRALPALVCMSILGLTTLAGLCARRWWGLTGAWFFLILAPTSSIIPMCDQNYAKQHRLYLPLAAVIVLALAGVLWFYRTYGRRPWWRSMACVLGAVLVATTFTYASWTYQRNVDYGDALAFRLDNLAKRPGNWFLHATVAHRLAQLGCVTRALHHFERAQELRPKFAWVDYNQAMLLARVGRTNAARGLLEQAMQRWPGEVDFYLQAAQLATAQGNTSAALNIVTHGIAACPAEPRLALERKLLSGGDNSLELTAAEFFTQIEKGHEE